MSGTAARLAVLRDLARLKSDRETARLAAVARSRARLRAALDGLGQAEPPLGDGAWRAAVVDGGAGGSGGDLPAAGVGVVGPGCDPGARGGNGPALSGAGAPVSGALTGPLALPDAAPGARGAALMVRARLAHAAWISAQRAQILARLALVEADWHRLLPPAARAFGQAEVLDRLSEAARRAARTGRAGGGGWARSGGAVPGDWTGPDGGAGWGPPVAGPRRWNGQSACTDLQSAAGQGREREVSAHARPCPDRLGRPP